jgi:hypothetical protein
MSLRVISWTRIGFVNKGPISVLLRERPAAGIGFLQLQEMAGALRAALMMSLTPLLESPTASVGTAHLAGSDNRIGDHQ